MKITNPSKLFENLLLPYSKLKIAVKSMREYYSSCLTNFGDMIQRAATESFIEDENPLAEIPIPAEVLGLVVQEGAKVMAGFRVSELRSYINGEAEELECVVSATGKTVKVSAEQIGSSIDELVDGLQGKISFLDVLLSNNDINQIKPADIISQLTANGFPTTNNFVGSVSSVFSSGVTWANVLNIFSQPSTETCEVEDEEYVVFNPDSYSNMNGLLLGVKSIGETVASFFSNIDFSLSKIGTLFEQFAGALIDMITWLAKKAFGQLFVDYNTCSNFNLEGFDVPVAMAKFDLSKDLHVGDENEPFSFIDDGFSMDDMTSDNHNHVYVYEVLNSNKNAISKVYLSNNFIWSQKAEEICLQHPGLYTFPLNNGFLVCQFSKDKKINVFLYAGAYYTEYRQPRLYLSDDGSALEVIGPAEADYDTRLVPVPEDVSSNETANEYIFQCLNGVIVGQGLSVSFPGMVGPLSYEEWMFTGGNWENRTAYMPGDWIDIFKQFYFSENDLNIYSLELLYSAIWLHELYTSDDFTSFKFKFKNKSGTIDGQLEDPIGFLPAWRPYYKDVYPQFYMHLQTDEERAKETEQAIISVIVAAAAAGATVGFFKLKKTFRFKVLQKESMIAAMQRDLGNDPTNTALTKAIFKQQKSLKLTKKISALLGNPVNTISKAVNENKTGDEQSSYDSVIYQSITGIVLED